MLAFLVGVWAAINGYAHYAVVLCFVGAGLVQLSDLRRDDVVGAFKDAIRITDIGVTKAAQWMGLDPADLCKMLRGLQKLDLWRIEMLPDETVRCFYYYRALRLGLPEFVKVAARMAPAFAEKDGI